MPKRLFAALTCLVFLFSSTPVSAQTSTPPPGPVYIVQPGDTLYDIAIRFNTGVQDIMDANGMSGADIYVGTQLIIPGLEGLSGTLLTVPVPFGESLLSLSRQYGVDPALLIQLNHIVSPAELYAGYNLVLLQQDSTPARTARATLGSGETLLELAARRDTDPWTLAAINALPGTQAGLPGDVLYLPSGDATVAPTGIPAVLSSAEVDPLPIVQGATVQIKLTSDQPIFPGGALLEHPLAFFQQPDGAFVALQGIHVLTDPGLYPLRIDLTLADGSSQSFEQMVLVKAGNFLTESLIVDPSYIDPTITTPEEEWLLSVVSGVTAEKYWQGMFQMPVASDLYCVKSKFGNRRTYNNGAYFGFHSGIDFGVCSPTQPFDIYAPADGVVVYTGLQSVRGNATLIDHGEGVFSGLYHQAEIYVSVGDFVTAGQLIGKIGDTGRVTGPHLHWDLWVNGFQVDPTPWLNETFPH